MMKFIGLAVVAIGTSIVVINHTFINLYLEFFKDVIKIKYFEEMLIFVVESMRYLHTKYDELW